MTGNANVKKVGLGKIAHFNSVPMNATAEQNASMESANVPRNGVDKLVKKRFVLTIVVVMEFALIKMNVIVMKDGLL